MPEQGAGKWTAGSKEQPRPWRVVDTHAHLHDTEFADDFDEVLRRALSVGIERIVLVGEDPENSGRAVALANSTACCWASVGVHPHRAGAFADSDIATVRALATSNSKVVAIGEIGLDYHYNFASRERQGEVFRAQLALARELDLPIIVHCREAYEDALKLLQGFIPPRTRWPWGVMHCYFGTVEQAKQFIGIGLILGIGGAVTFKKAESVHEVVRTLPLDAFVVETDAPYMAPVPYRGKRNEPSYLVKVIERIAELKATSRETVAAATTDVAYRLFRWPRQ